MNPSRKIEAGFFLFLAFGTAVVVFFIFKPYLSALFVALVFALVFKPVHRRILGVFRQKSVAALVTLLLLLLLVLVPAFIIGFSIADDAQKLYTSFVEGEPLFKNLDTVPIPFEVEIEKFAPDIRGRISDYVSGGLSFVVSRFGNVFTEVVSFIFKTLIMLLALFYLLREGRPLRDYIVRLSPLTNEYDERILNRLEDAVVSVVKGRLFIIIIQGIIGGLGFFMFSIPHPVLLGVLVSLAALVPAVGVAIVFAPIIIYLFLVGATVPAVGLLVVASVVGFVDNVLSPFLFERGLRVHPFLILLSILGGLTFFGPIGFLAGPITLSLFFALLDIYPLLFEGSGNQNVSH
ncbi:MAG: AI-2E family transporter [bacterium]|nr:AI-2E family transporter [bacterium]